jgi:tetratricopeptide (TPR) repeat protein
LPQESTRNRNEEEAVVSVHVDLDIADFVAGRLSEARQKVIEDHLRQCDTCAAEVAWANEFRNQALRQGLRHLDPMRIVELSLRHTVASDTEQEHLDSCDRCRTEVAWSEELPTPSAKTTRRRPLRLALLAAAAVITVALLFIPRGDRFNPSQFAIVEPLSVRVSRSIPEPGSFEESRLLGLDAYKSGDFGSALEHFLHASSMESDHPELLLYLGSAELLDGRVDPAIEHLRQAMDNATEPAVRDEATWQLVNALLLSGLADEAEDLLTALAEGEGRRADEARSLQQAVRAAR